jgi:ATP-dependent protease ClpP protease subunit
MERERFFTGEEAIAYGLVDRVLEPRARTWGAGFGER